MALWEIAVASAAIDSMEVQRPIDSLPEICVLDGHHFAVALPLPAAGAPFVELGNGEVADADGADSEPQMVDWDRLETERILFAASA